MRIVERSSTEDRKMNAQQLKNAILQEAIEGRLVPQDPNDEPASILLERIRKEKERLVKEGKLKKKDLEVKPISEDEIPFEIPDSWEWVRLGTLISYQNGYAYNSSEMNKEGKGVPVIKSGNLMTLEVVFKPNNDYIECPTKKMLLSKIVKGDMLMCLSSQSDNPEPLGKTAIYRLDTYALLNQRVLKFRPYKDELTPYLYYTINSFYFWYNVSHQGGGSAQANLKLNHVLDMQIPLPPLAEQKRIVAKIEELLPKVEKYGKAQDELNKLNEELPERLKKSILQEAIEGRLVPQDPNDEPASVLLQKIREEKEQLVKAGKLKKKDFIETPISEDEIPFAIPDTWEWVRLSSLLQLISDGTHKTPNYVPIGIPFLSVQNISSGKLTMDKIKYISEEEHNLLIKRVKPALGDILICRIGTLGKALKIYWDFEFSIFVSLGLLRPVNERLTDYIVFCINSPLGFNWIQNHKVGGGTHTYKINLGDMPNMLIPIPPFPEQKRIKLKIEQIFAEIDKLKK